MIRLFAAIRKLFAKRPPVLRVVSKVECRHCPPHPEHYPDRCALCAEAS
jgi:hypothetical protein